MFLILNQVNQLIWCLRHRLLLQLHTYVFYMNLDIFDSSHDHTDLGSPTIRLSQDDDVDENNENYFVNHEIVIGSHPKIINVISRVSENVVRSVLDSDQFADLKMDGKEKESILKVAIENSVSVDILELFLRLKGHFDGTRHLEDIMFHEGVDRESINQVIESFKPILCTSQSEDTAVATLSPYFHTFN